MKLRMERERGAKAAGIKIGRATERKNQLEKQRHRITLLMERMSEKFKERVTKMEDRHAEKIAKLEEKHKKAKGKAKAIAKARLDSARQTARESRKEGIARAHLLEREKAKVLKATRKELQRILKSVFPDNGEIQAKFMSALTDVTPQTMAKVMARVQREIQKLELKEAHRELKTIIKLIEKVGRSKNRRRAILPKYMVPIRAVLDAIQPSRLADRAERIEKLREQIAQESDPEVKAKLQKDLKAARRMHRKRATLESRIEAIENNPDVDLSHYDRDQLKRLVQVAIPDMTQEEAEEHTQFLARQFNNSQHWNKIQIRNEDREAAGVLRAVMNEINSPDNPLKMQKRERDSFGRLVPERDSNMLTIAAGTEEQLLLDSLTQLISGGRGITWQALYKDVDSAYGAGIGHYRHSVDHLNAILKGLGYELGGEELAKMGFAFGQVKNRLAAAFSRDGASPTNTTAVPHEIELEAGARQVTTEKDGKQVVTGTETTRRTMKITAAERIHIILTLMDPRSRDLIIHKGVPIQIKSHNDQTESWTITAEDEKAIMLSSNENEIAIAREMHKYINGPLKKIARIYSMLVHNYDFTIEDYTPRHRTGVARDEFNLGNSRTLDKRVLESSNILQERKNSVDQKLPISIRDAFAEFSDHAWQVSMVTQLGPALRNARKILDSAEFRTTVANSRGSRLLNRFETIYDEMTASVVGRPASQLVAERGMRPKLQDLVKGLLGNNPMVASYQPWSMLAAMTELDPMHVMGAIMSGSMFDDSIDAKITSNDYLWFRTEGSAMGLIGEGMTPGQTKLGGFKPQDERAFIMIRYMDNLAIRTIWAASERQVRSEVDQMNEQRKRDGKEDMTEEEIQMAISERAETVVKRTQPTFDPLHESASGIESRRSATAKAFAMFRAQRAKNVDIMYREAIRMANDPSSAGVRLRNIFMVAIAQGMGIAVTKRLWWLALAMPALLAGGELPDDDEEEYKKWAKNMIDVTAGNWVFGSTIAYAINRMVVGGKSYSPSISPMESMVTDILGGMAGMGMEIKKLATDEDPNWTEFFDDFVTATAAASGWLGKPVVSPIRLSHRVYKNIRDEDKGSGSGSRGRSRRGRSKLHRRYRR